MGGGGALWSLGTNCSAGVGLLLQPGRSIEVIGSKIDLDGRVIAVKLKCDGLVTQIVNIYATNIHMDRENFFDNLWRHLFRNTPTILGGDFNCISDICKDKWGGDDSFGAG